MGLFSLHLSLKAEFPFQSFLEFSRYNPCSNINQRSKRKLNSEIKRLFIFKSWQLRKERTYICKLEGKVLVICIFKFINTILILNFCVSCFLCNSKLNYCNILKFNMFLILIRINIVNFNQIYFPVSCPLFAVSFLF